MTIDITIRYNDTFDYPQEWYTNRNGQTVFVTTIYSPLTPEQRRDIERLYDPRIVESTIEQVKAS